MKKSECVEALRKRGYDCEEEGSVVIVYGETDEKAIRRVLSEIGYKASFGISSRTRKTEKDEERSELADDEEMMLETEAGTVEESAAEEPPVAALYAQADEDKEEQTEDKTEDTEEKPEEAEASVEEVEEQMDIFRVDDAHQTSIFDFL
ncbi:MAG: hypothetical protein IJU25_02635 [Lachnospiraceae bacterium]|nr:hypothetical protein [Lachnospiraceae bacterium]